ncbi:MAG: c-type cytochrome domain-containing protein [Pirellulales bacterium]
MNRWLTAFLIWGGLAVSWAQGADAVDFNRDIRPILSNKCFRCHGPDEAERKGGENGLRFDTANGWLEDLRGYAAVVPGKPDESELIARIKADDADSVMPPPSLGKPLTPREVELLEQWVADGAKYSRHWSYVKPAAELPEVKAADWARGPLDLFVLARLNVKGWPLHPRRTARRLPAAWRST